MVVAVAHCPTVGVKLYVVVPLNEVLIDEGVQLPFIPLVELPGKDGGTAF